MSGYLVPPAAPEALANAIISVYLEPDFSKEMALYGKRIVLQEFNLHRNVEKISKLYSGLIPLTE